MRGPLEKQRILLEDFRLILRPRSGSIFFSPRNLLSKKKEVRLAESEEEVGRMDLSRGRED